MKRALFNRLPKQKCPVHSKKRMKQASRRILSRYCRRWSRLETKFLAGDTIEPLHKMRVTIRRIRIHLRVFSSVFPRRMRKRVEKPLQRMTRILGRVRDFDTVLAYLVSLICEASPGNGAFLRAVQQDVQYLREDALTQIETILLGTRYSKLQKALYHLISGKSKKKLGVVREEVPRRILVLVDRITQNPLHESSCSDTELHTLRLHLKALRYLCQDFCSCYPRPLRKWIKRMEAMQDCLGEVQDKSRDIQFLRHR
ncbi:MAG: CHAD domain-containing protein, partial [Candidatus Omnitrophica bacterium]|nr:CHAD domain-containing protein [Candidatus Omnitrophota bacterium]